MNPALLSRLPDTVKLGILRHLWADGTENQVVLLPPQQPEESQAAQEGVSPSPATSAATPMQRDEPAAATTVEDSCAHALVQQRRLDGGLAVIDGFLDGAVVEVRVTAMPAQRCIMLRMNLLPKHSSRLRSRPAPLPRLLPSQAVREEAQAVLAVHSRGAGMVAACAAAQGSAEVPHVWTSAASRGDRAAWLSLTDLQASGRRRLADAVQSLLALQPWLQQQGYDVGGRPSLQLACYPGGGARYVRHRDGEAGPGRRGGTHRQRAWCAGTALHHGLGHVLPRLASRPGHVLPARGWRLACAARIRLLYQAHTASHLHWRSLRQRAAPHGDRHPVPQPR